MSIQEVQEACEYLAFVANDTLLDIYLSHPNKEDIADFVNIHFDKPFTENDACNIFEKAVDYVIG